MKNKYRNIFLAFGIIAVLIMIFTFDMDYQELWANLKRAGVYLPLVLLLWLFVYLINTVSWYIIIRSSGKTGFSFARLYKFTVTGFALNYVTPVGLMGGEPYRIMELKPYIGIERATSSVILYVMMHIFSHFCFWLSSVLLYVCLYPVGWVMGIILGAITVFCLLIATLFIKGLFLLLVEKGDLFVYIFQLLFMRVSKMKYFLFQKRNTTTHTDKSHSHPLPIAFHKKNNNQQAKDSNSS